MAKGKIENLKSFKKGHHKIGGRKKGTPNKCKPEDLFNEIATTLNKEHVFYDANGNPQKKKWREWIVLGLFKKITKKGDAAAMALVLRVFGLLKDNLELTGEIKTPLLSPEQLKEELLKYGTTKKSKSVRTRKTKQSTNTG